LDEVLGGLDADNRRRALRWLERTARSQMPWVLAAHRVEDVPGSATHALILDGGRIAYRGALARAPIERWLGESRPESFRVRSHRRSANRLLLRLSHASVYLDERAALEGISFSVRSGECWV